MKESMYPKVHKTQIPIITGQNYEHIMGDVAIIESDVVTIEIRVCASGKEASNLITLLTAGEPMGLSFVALPVTPRVPKAKEIN